MRRILLAVLLLAAACGGDDSQTVAFVGDSNMALARPRIREQFDDPDVRAEFGAAIRAGTCPTLCTDTDWTVLLDGLDASVVVVNLGVNDAVVRGTPTTQGWADYGGKIDWLMELLPPDADVYWTNLPCELVAPDRAKGCPVVNAALAEAGSRWENLTVVDWAAAAEPSQMSADQVHLTKEGYEAWVSLVRDEIER